MAQVVTWPLRKR